MVNLIGWIAAGAFVGWLVSRLTKNYALHGLLLNLLAGIVGALLAGRVLAPLVGLAVQNPDVFSLPAFLAALAGAVGLLAAVILLRRNSVEL